MKPADPQGSAALTWAEIVDHCSRLHTTRTRPMGPWPDAELREDSHMLDIWFDDEQGRTAAVVVPTRMHEPGFYVRGPNGSDPFWTLGSDDEMARFKRLVDAGQVTRRGE